jgi:hypothetical protein
VVGVFRDGSTTPDFKTVQISNGKVRPASGTLNFSGDITLSAATDPASIETLRQGSLTVTRT